VGTGQASCDVCLNNINKEADAISVYDIQELADDFV
jgi:hypothetical protein